MPESKRCAGCGASFGCGRNDTDCWCTALPALPAAVLDGLRDCYCPPCLEAILAARRDDTPSLKQPQD